MSGQQGYIYQKNNKLPDAVISATVSPSAKPPLVYPVTKRGHGNMRLFGNYNGPIDTKYDLMVKDTAIETPIVSAPVFRGAGTGKISGIVASGLEAQKIHVLCLSTGTDTAKAEIEIEGLKFRAKNTGSSGNAISIAVDDSLLTFTQTDYSTIKVLKVGDTAIEGQEWDFDTKVIQGNLIPTDAHRIAFGLDRLHVYLQYKKFEDGKWKYYFIMPVQYEVNAGSRMYFVTGGRKIIVTDGITTETYTGIVSIADFWLKVKESSDLIEPVDSSIDTTRAATSPAVREFATKTDAYFLPPYKGEQSSIHAGQLDSMAVTNQAKTELIEIKCADNAYLGAEIWNVKGSSSGEMGQARTGDISNFGHVSFVIPQKFPENWDQKIREDWSYEVQYASRAAGVTLPPICFSMKLGINAKAQTLTLEYKKKPPTCVCPPVSFSDKCLGLEEEGGEIGMAYTVPDLIFWTDVKMDVKKEASWNTLAYEDAEGRSGGVSVSGYIGWYNNFETTTSEYVRNFKSLAHRIMNLPEDAPSQLQAMVDSYKALIESLTISSVVGFYNRDDFAQKNLILEVTYNTSLYITLCETVLQYEKTYGVKKNSVIAIGTCYIDAGGEYYWEVRGDKAYLPAYTDVPYYSTVRAGDLYENTKEFAFLISAPCGALAVGDKIIVTISGMELERTYQVGDITYLPTIAKQNLNFHGGVDGDDLYTFSVSGELNKFSNYILDRDNPQRYYTQQLQFQITEGIIQFQVGDLFEFAIEGGHFIWRKDAGAWSSPVAIGQEIQTFDSGLQIGFDFGVSPSFCVGDRWEVLCIQENKAANLALPWREKYKGTGNITFTFASQVTIDCLLIDLHDLTGTITFQASDNENFGTLVHDEEITVSDLICRLYLDAGITAQYFRLLITGERQIGYVFLGSIMQLSSDADAIRPLRRYQMSRQESKEPFSLYKHLKRGFTVEYNSFIYNADFILLDEMIDYLKSNNDMPFYFLANVNYPDKLCVRAYIDTDNIEPGSDIDLNAPEDKRIYSLTFPVVGVR